MKTLQEVFVVVMCYAFRDIKPTVWIFDTESDAKKKYETVLAHLSENQTVHIYKEVVFENKLM